MELLFLLLEIGAEILLEFGISSFFGGLAEVSEHNVKKLRKKKFDARVARARAAGEPEPEPPKPFSWAGAMAGYAILGILFGVLSLLLFPHSFIKTASGRLFYLFFAPTVAGMGMSLVGRVREKKGEEPIRLDNFYYGFLFTFAMTLVRYYIAV
ncbi:MAG: hypothetical protein A2W80_14280 [Candidatus Riflebacteria bacterium GWC2_50_8]|nr:MAG: hypothetical protein A2W80_14280 [Candidatus Riflebacteria bacterium GWC2_50_8]